MRNVKLLIEYDGTDFLGWQWQPKGRTVEGVLKSSLQSLLQTQPKLYGSGRTDSGVHALAQAANFKTTSDLSNEQLRDGLNYYLPSDIRILSAEDVADDFHARHSAKGRLYRYVISKYQRAIGRQYAWYYKPKLDVDSMNHAAELLLGRHSFKAFARENPNEQHYLCDIEQAGWRTKSDQLMFEIKANRFLHNMVRIIVGTLLEIGRGKTSPDVVSKMLNNEDKASAGMVVPPHGLFLVRVEF